MAQPRTPLVLLTLRGDLVSLSPNLRFPDGGLIGFVSQFAAAPPPPRVILTGSTLKQNAKYVVLGILLAGLGIAWKMSRTTQVPDGQPTLTTLSSANLPSLFQQFDAASDRTRVVVLLSPS